MEVPERLEDTHPVEDSVAQVVAEMVTEEVVVGRVVMVMLGLGDTERVRVRVVEEVVQLVNVANPLADKDTEGQEEGDTVPLPLLLCVKLVVMDPEEHWVGEVVGVVDTEALAEKEG